MEKNFVVILVCLGIAAASNCPITTHLPKPKEYNRDHCVARVKVKSQYQSGGYDYYNVDVEKHIRTPRLGSLWGTTYYCAYSGSIRIPKECNAKLLAGASYIVIDDGAFVKKFSELTMPEKGFLQALKKTQG